MGAEPAGIAGTVNVTLQTPLALACVAEPTALPPIVTWTLASFAAKPVPFTVTDTPGTPVALLIVKLGSTLKAWGETDDATVVVPKAPMGAEPAGIAGTVNVTFQTPAALAVWGVPTLVPPIVAWTLASFAANPVPFIVTDVPEVPLVLVMVIAGVTVLVKVAVAVLELLSVATTL
jgi:hypothetical protein